ncbi:flagellin [Paenibacillus sp. NPDC058174]|uniref:flagellin n=1 Tax=Paenibacillus sp. NPDC058174 TaxID=3346366 RepID=UPI0036DC1B87
MRITHNISALNADNILKKNNEKLSKSSEKLASGLRINRAADDAAGLSISESMRGQIRGLQQAERNVQDGISVVQTADGGMQEISNIIARQKELLVQGMNGTYSDQDKRMIELEIRQLNEAIDNIAESNTFNTINLLARSDYQIYADRSSTDTTMNISDPPTDIYISKSPIYAPAGTPGTPRQKTRDTDTTTTTQTYSSTSQTTPKVFPDGREGYNDYKVDTQTTTKTDTNTKVYETTAPTTNPVYTDPAYWYTVGRNDTYFGSAHHSQLYGNMVENIEVDGVSRALEYGSRTNPGTVPAVDHFVFPNTDISVTRYRTINADNSIEIRYEMKNNGTTDSTINMSNSLNPPKNAVMIDDTGNPLPPGNHVISPVSGNVFHMEGEEANASVEFDDGLGLAAPTGLTINNTVPGEPQINFNWEYNLAQGQSMTIGFKYGPLSLSPNIEVLEHTTETEVTRHIESEVVTDITDIDYAPPQLVIQAGEKAHETIEIPLFNVKASGLGLSNIGILPPSNPSQSLAQTEGALAKVTNVRAIHGSLQNRMEHTMNNVGNYQENLAAAESRIRDTDIAKEMVNITLSNIVSQSAQAMLAQANNNPQAVLQLMKS